MNAARHIDIDSAADTEPSTALETPMWLGRQNAEALLRDALRKIEGLEAANALIASVERARCIAKCEELAREYAADADRHGEAVAQICADAISILPRLGASR